MVCAEFPGNLASGDSDTGHPVMRLETVTVASASVGRLAFRVAGPGDFDIRVLVTAGATQHVHLRVSPGLAGTSFASRRDNPMCQSSPSHRDGLCKRRRPAYWQPCKPPCAPSESLRVAARGWPTGRRPARADPALQHSGAHALRPARLPGPFPAARRRSAAAPPRRRLRRGARVRARARVRGP